MTVGDFQLFYFKRDLKYEIRDERSLTSSKANFTFVPGGVFSSDKAVGSISMAEYVFCPSVHTSFSNFGAVLDDSLALGAETLRTFMICRTISS